MPFVEKRVDEDRAAAIDMIRLSGQQGVPVIVVDGQVVVGFDRPRLEKLLEGAADGRVPFGASVANASKILMQQGKLPVFGAYVGKVAPGSPAARAQLQPGDIITEINLRPIRSADDAARALGDIRPGARLIVKLSRGDRVLQTEVRV